MAVEWAMGLALVLGGMRREADSGLPSRQLPVAPQGQGAQAYRDKQTTQQGCPTGRVE
jgi:hypothetical protein